MKDYSFNIGILNNIEGYELKGLTPDANGFFSVILGCLGLPSRNGVLYDVDSYLFCMQNQHAKFNIALREGQLLGEWDHPEVLTTTDPKDVARLFRLESNNVSHLFGEISVNATEFITLNGVDIIPIKGKVKPVGKKGPILEQSLRDLHWNTAFSQRTLCTPMQGPDRNIQYRKVESLITYDAVPCPGYGVASKRYAVGNESFESNVNLDTLHNSIRAKAGNESSLLISLDEIERLGGRPIDLNSKFASGVSGKRSFTDNDYKNRDAASLAYGKRR